MSRRRTPFERGDWFVYVVCTDRGTHDETRLGLLSWWPGGPYPDDEGGTVDAEPFMTERGGRRTRPGHSTRRPQRTRYPDDGDRRKVLAYRCPRCCRDVPLRWETAQAHVEAAYRVRVSRLDISSPLLA